MKLMVTGHRPDKLGGYKTCPKQKEVKKVIKDVLCAFGTAEIMLEEVITGMALGVDQWFALEALTQKLPVRPYVPFVGQESKWPPYSQANYKKILESCLSSIIVCDGGYASWKMQKRNEAMIYACDVALAVWNGTSGGTGNCVKVLLEKDKPVVQYDPETKGLKYLNWPASLTQVQVQLDVLSLKPSGALSHLRPLRKIM